MNKLLHNLAKVIIIALTGVMIWKCTSNHSENDENNNIVTNNQECYELVKEDLLAITCLVEGFHKTPYHCGKKWTIGFGTTIYPNGKKVCKTDKEISLSFAKQCVYDHYDKNVWPWIQKYVTRTLTPEQMIGTCSFIYNIGGEAFSGHKKNGKKFAKASNFLTAINNGEDDYETAICMNGFRGSGGKLANGLPKRHWIEGAVYLGLITTDDILFLEPKRFYEKKHGFDISFYYKNRKDPYWTHDYSKEKIREFLQKNNSDTNNVKTLL